MEPRYRIGNAEREQATRELARHYEDGRLDHEEYAERLDAAWTAKTHDDLRILFVDLPRALPATVSASRPARRQRAWAHKVATVVLVIVLLAMVFD